MAARKTSRVIQIIALVVVLVAANSFLGFSIAQEAKRAITDQIQGRMLDLASSAAALLDGDSLGKLKAEDAGTPEYERALDTLRAFQDNVDVSYVYGVRKVGDKKFVFTVDPADDPGEFGEEVACTDALERASEGTPSVDMVAYEDRWGRFYSAYYPVFDSSGKVAGIVAVDFDAAWYEGHAESIDRMAFVNCLASIILALIAVFVVLSMTRAENRHAEILMRANRYDALTGLPNMGYFIEYASDLHDDMVKKGEKPAMLFADLVGMKFFNQKYGFEEGDKLLKAFAELMAATFGDERVSRFGQDHFVASTNAENLDARLGSFFEECTHINGGKNVPVRVGIYLDSPDGLIGASAACDRAKTACDAGGSGYGSSYSYFDSDMMAALDQRQYVIDNLDRAIEEGWIEVHYQPIVRSATGKVCDEEALARWRDPERGLFAPADFVPALEDSKLVYRMDLCVLEQVLAKMQTMADEGLYVVPSSINLSRSDFEMCDIVEEVRARVDAAGVEHGMVNIEITESAIGSDFEFMKVQVERFHDLGFQVWMDDFGSEYSSLDYLQGLEFDLMKLDMRFMQQFDQGDKTKIILTELVKMAMALGIDVIAEGVETQEQVDFLRRIGCNKMQGYFFTKPNPLEVILERYKTGIAIGFENPAEAQYYSALGRVNLYDLSTITRGDEEVVGKYFDVLPMSLVECVEGGFMVSRCNGSYYQFIEKVIGDGRVGEVISYAQVDPNNDNPFVKAVRECSKSGGRLTLDETMADGSVVHALVCHIADNPVTGASALAVAVLAVVKK